MRKINTHTWHLHQHYCAQQFKQLIIKTPPLFPHSSSSNHGQSSLLREDGPQKRPLEPRGRPDSRLLYPTARPWKLASSAQTSWAVEVREELPAPMDKLFEAGHKEGKLLQRGRRKHHRIAPIAGEQVVCNCSKITGENGQRNKKCLAHASEEKAPNQQLSSALQEPLSHFRFRFRKRQRPIFKRDLVGDGFVRRREEGRDRLFVGISPSDRREFLVGGSGEGGAGESGFPSPVSVAGECGGIEERGKHGLLVPSFHRRCGHARFT